MNCLAVEAGGRIAVVDCGVLFPDEHLGVDVVLPDLTWLEERAAQVDAVFLTHGHEDHVGALPFLLRRLPVPVYGTRFTLAAVRGRLAEAGLSADLREVAPGDVRESGPGSPISAEWIAVTHSIPDACALALRTPQGTLVHSGDFKLDEHPVAGPPVDLARLAALGREGVRLLLSDSTNADRPGTALPEAAVGPGARRGAGGGLGPGLRGRLLLQRPPDAAGGGRRARPAGGGSCCSAAAWSRPSAWPSRSGSSASRTGCRWRPTRRPGCRRASSASSPPAARASRAAPSPAWRAPSTPTSSWRAGDTVVLSARTIPGNELAVGRLLDDLCRRGATLLGEGPLPLHASGHAQEAEQRRLVALLRPERFVPVHGDLPAPLPPPRARRRRGRGPRALPPPHRRDGAGARRRRRAGAAGARPHRPGLRGARRAGRQRRAAPRGTRPPPARRGRALPGGAGGGPHHRRGGPGPRAVRHGRGRAGGRAGRAGRRGAGRGREALSPAERASPGEVQETLRTAVRRWFRRTTGRRPAVLPVVLEL